MSDYRRVKALRIPICYVNLAKYIPKLKELELNEDWSDNLVETLPQVCPELFSWSDEVNKFEYTITEGSHYIDYTLEVSRDGNEGEYTKHRLLTKQEKRKYEPIFHKMDDDLDMNRVRLVEYCWYTCSEPPDCYDDINDPFYNEV